MEGSDNYDELRKAFRSDSGKLHFQATIYINTLKIVGEVALTMDTRSTSRRASDFLRHFPSDYMTLSHVKIFDRDLNAVIDEPDYIIVNVKKLDAIYARELDKSQAGGPDDPSFD